MRLALACLCLAAATPASAAADRPNILFILADDLGWRDLACTGNPWHRTPNLDRLASQGIRLTHAYAAAPICSASRASILTGKTTARVGLEFVVKAEPGSQVIEPPQPLAAPPYKLQLDLGHTTVAEHLLDAGYHTAFFGKWHLNPHHQGRYLAWSPTHGPRQQGFETATEDFGSHPYNKRKLAPLTTPDTYHPDALTGHAVRFIERDHDRPFFLTVSHFYVHTPVRTPNTWLLEDYAGRIPAGVPRREQRIAYAAFVETLDHHVGRLLDALDRSPHASNTLVVFTSDNGGHPEFASNAPLRGSKWNLYEGGLRVPFIARWPGHIPAGTTSATPAIGYDLLPTFAAAAGAPAEHPDLDGTDLLPVLTNPGSDAPDRPLFWHFPYYHPEGGKFAAAIPAIGVDDFAVSQTRPASAVGLGHHKLVSFAGSGRAELYDLRSDPGEQRDLAGEQPERAAALASTLAGYLDRVGARRAMPR